METQKLYSRLEEKRHGQQGPRKAGRNLPFNQVQTGGSLDNMAHLAGLQSKSGILELLLHVTLAKETAKERSVSARYGAENGSRTYRSPLFLELLQSLSVVARSPRLVAPLLILASWPRMMVMASSLERVIWASRQLEGRRESLCLTRRCEARILPSC